MKFSLFVSMGVVATVLSFSSSAEAHQPYDPADPRPDFIAHRFYQNHDSYRRVYNRPRYVPGYLAWKLEPTSQEAYAWEQSYCAGYYDTNCPTPVANYLYPKPWEALDVGPRRKSKKETTGTQSETPRENIAEVDVQPNPKSPEKVSNGKQASPVKDPSVKESTQDPAK